MTARRAISVLALSDAAPGADHHGAVPDLLEGPHVESHDHTVDPPADVPQPFGAIR